MNKTVRRVRKKPDNWQTKVKKLLNKQQLNEYFKQIKEFVYNNKKVTAIASVGFVIILVLLFSVLLKPQSKVKLQKEAIELSLEQEKQNSGKLFIVKCTDLEEQLDKQVGDKDDESVSVILNVYFPEAKDVNLQEVELEEPNYDVKTVYQKDFNQEFYKAAYTGMEKYISSSKNTQWKPIRLQVRLDKTGKTWNATLNKKDVENIISLIENSVQVKVRELLENNENYKKLQVLVKLPETLKSIFEDTTMQNATKIERIDKNSDMGFTVTIAYPQAESVYTQATEQCYEYYKSNNTKVYGEITQAKVQSILQPYIKQAISKTATTSTSTITVLANNSTTKDFEDLKNEIKGIRDPKITQLIAKLNSRFTVPSRPRPLTTIETGSRLSGKVTIYANGNKDHYITIYRVIGTRETKRKTIYIRAKETAVVYLTSGVYRIEQATGTQWFGDSYVFGPEGTYYKSNQTFQVRLLEAYAITLNDSSGSNLPSDKIEYPYKR